MLGIWKVNSFRFQPSIVERKKRVHGHANYGALKPQTSNPSTGTPAFQTCLAAQREPGPGHRICSASIKGCVRLGIWDSSLQPQSQRWGEVSEGKLLNSFLQNAIVGILTPFPCCHNSPSLTKSCGPSAWLVPHPTHLLHRALPSPGIKELPSCREGQSSRHTLTIYRKSLWGFC